ncbi:DUF2017 family protein [Amycolatopsis sp.]|uniref:DUF2017 family protein n=1 Tax=Amycolatopsis sp. TaxID=37632 RepID=UPI002C5157B9|nr:DUF2017 family protein [Amycolatopsis sp.]HVV09950.1 DUF2017 family protein [Amycolatopsis sp.]
MYDSVQAGPAGDSVRLVMSEPAARRFRVLIMGFLASLDSVKDRRLFPDAFADKGNSSGFRAAHGAGMREELAGAARRVLAAWPDAPDVTLPPELVRDWLIVLSHAQTKYLGRRRHKRRRLGTGAEYADVLWLRAAHDRVAAAALGVRRPPFSGHWAEAFVSTTAAPSRT